MQTIRKRVPFSSPDEDEITDKDDRILDEQEQENLIQSLKEANQRSNVQSQIILQGILVLSLVLQVFSLFKNPFIAMFPPATAITTPEIPLPIPFTLLNVFLHFNLAFVAFRDELRSYRIFLPMAFNQLPYQLVYAIAAVPTTLSMFLHRPWQSTAWWALTILVIFTAQSVSYSINEGNKSITELESMRYTAPGA